MNNSDIMYIEAVRFPSERAHAAQIFHTIVAFARAGKTVDLVVPKRKGSIAMDPFLYYQVPKDTRIAITYLNVPDTVKWGRVGFLFHQWRFGIAAKKYAAEKKPSVLYSRDESILYTLRTLKIPMVWESHLGRLNFFIRQLVPILNKIVVISNGLKQFYETSGISGNLVVVAHDAIDLSAFMHPENTEAARKRLGLPEDATIAMYVGSLEDWKGYRTFLDASRIAESVRFVVIGGSDAAITPLKSEYPTVTFLGGRPYAELADNQIAADVLVIPNTATNELSARFTSPLKLFAHMASGVPIVASDVASIREVVSEKEVFFAIPDSPESLAKTIQDVLADPNTSKEKAAQARSLVTNYTWDKRAEHILAAMSENRMMQGR